MKLFIGFIIMLISVSCYGQGPQGVWQTVDDTDGQAKSLIKIYEKDKMLYGKIIELLPAATVTHCDKCKGEDKGRSLIDMHILREMYMDGDKWDGGYILDPAKGKEYKCQIALEDANTLKVRGYIGNPLFGRTQYWYRVE